jgi:uncharacterized protein (TIGR02270 family)
MVDLLEVHVDELAWLWRQRFAALRSAGYDVRALTQLDERIAAHVDALVLAGEEAHVLLHSRLRESEDAHAALGVAHALLLQEDAAVARQTLDLFLELEGAAWEGFRLALRYAPLDRYAEILGRIAAGSSEPHAAAALEALAFHGKPDTGDRLLALLDAAQPDIRHAAWKTVSLLDARWLEAPGQARFRQGLAQRFPVALTDASPEVRDAARWAAAWTRQGWLLSSLRTLAKAPAAPDYIPGLRLLAVLGTQADVPLFQEVVGMRELGPERFLLVGTFGHPSLMEEVLRAMESGGAATAAAASLAFRKMTGIDVNTSQRVAVPLEEGQEGDEASTEEVLIPDAVVARGHWSRLKGTLSGVTRLCMGADAMKGGTQDWRRGLPLDARWEHSLREHFEAGRGGGMFALERFPHLPE